MNDERERPENESAAETQGAGPEEKALDLSEELRKGYSMMPVDSTTEVDIVDDMGGLPDPEPTSPQDTGQQSASPEPSSGPAPDAAE